MEQDRVWKFDSTVAADFVGHARQHIPNYDLVIDKAVKVCQKFLYHTDAIIDVGCATGETLRRLSEAGFTNLVGVDSSADMLDKCQALGDLILSDHLPLGPYKAVICNWTLHFIADKLSYLQDIYNSLEPNGLLFLTDKTSKDSMSIEFYHDFKRQQGVSDEGIALKAQQVESMMYVNPPAWYLESLARLGFRNTQIADASWCFTTFVCVK